MCCFFLSLPIHAEEQQPIIKLELKPNICILSAAESHCEDRVVAEWKAADQKNYSLCLFQKNGSVAIECWKNSSVGKTEFTQTIANTTLFELRAMSDQRLLGQDVFQVINAQKKNQRTRRNPWSFF